ncbi:MAG: FGGY-family carbohydrate kinase, partial [bacterium]
GDSSERGEQSDIGDLAKAAETSTVGSRGLVFLPFLDGAASPHADAQARGAFLGATSTHRRGDFVRAVMEGVAYNFREAFETFAGLGQVTRRIRIGGGGSRSVLWQGILADVIGTGLDLLAEHDASALGAAVISAVGTGAHADFTHACKTMVRIRGSVEPDKRRQELYREYYAVYQAFHPRVRELSHTLGGLARRSVV